MYQQEDICAIATGAVSSAIAIIRISGKNILQKVLKFLQFQQNISIDTIKPRYLYRAKIITNNQFIDDILFVYFKSPNSYTGEDMIELHCHGSLYIQGQILKILQQLDIRLSQPGEFTLRAFLNGKMDLTQAEAVNEIIQARDQTAHQLAIQHIKGEISKEIKEIRNELLNLLVYVELELDFAEEDVEFASRENIKNNLERLIQKIEQLSISYDYGNVIKNGVLVSIVGETNVGKSTLMNRLLNEDKSIVSSIPGTTRDIIEDSFVHKNITFRFADTAGIRNTENEVEQIGIEKAIKKAQQSSIVLLLLDAATETEQILNKYNEWKNKLNNKNQLFLVLNKIDKLEQKTLNNKVKVIKKQVEKVFLISAKYNININNLLDEMYEYIISLNISGSEVIITNSRQWNALKKALESAKTALISLNSGISNDLLAEDLKQVNHYLSEVTSEIPSQEILNEIFSRFCIGK
jgi:tRNA modification GTPase